MNGKDIDEIISCMIEVGAACGGCEPALLDFDLYGLQLWYLVSNWHISLESVCYLEVTKECMASVVNKKTYPIV